MRLRRIYLDEASGLCYLYAQDFPLIPLQDLSADDTCCNICLDAYHVDKAKDSPLKLPNCGHIFGRECVESWIDKNKHFPSCPMCRAPIFDRATGPPLFSAAMGIRAAANQYTPVSDAELDGVNPALADLLLALAAGIHVIADLSPSVMDEISHALADPAFGQRDLTPVTTQPDAVNESRVEPRRSARIAARRAGGGR